MLEFLLPFVPKVDQDTVSVHLETADTEDVTDADVELIRSFG